MKKRTLSDDGQWGTFVPSKEEEKEVKPSIKDKVTKSSEVLKSAEVGISKSYEDMTKVELKALLQESGKEFDARWGKAKMIDALNGVVEESEEVEL